MHSTLEQRVSMIDTWVRPANYRKTRSKNEYFTLLLCMCCHSDSTNLLEYLHFGHLTNYNNVEICSLLFSEPAFTNNSVRDM